jgi:hypothetical protein
VSETAGVAQLVEHLICNQRVRGSNPFASSSIDLEQFGGIGAARWLKNFSIKHSIRKHFQMRCRRAKFFVRTRFSVILLHPPQHYLSCQKPELCPDLRGLESRHYCTGG